MTSEPKTGYPQSTLLDLVDLARRLVTGRGRASTSERLVEWVHHLRQRYQSDTIMVNLLVRRLLLVTDPALSAHILAEPPSQQQYVAGTLKQKAMAFLAPRALTIAQDEQWQNLRHYHETVLFSGRSHCYEQGFLAQIHQAFALPVVDMADLRQRMGQVMIGVIFGAGNAPAHLIDDIQELFAEVNPRTALLGSKKGDKRDAFYQQLRQLWTLAAADHPTLLALAQRAKQDLPAADNTEALLIEQIPHWMFTFTNSGADLLGRTLALITARPAVLSRVRQELAAAGPLTAAATIHHLPYLEACLLEAGRLYPPVLQTVHKAAAADEFQGMTIPAGTEIMHFFPITNRDAERDPLANAFRPERWLDADDPVHQLYPNLFLSGARACPGRSLILFVDKAALACLLQHQSDPAKTSVLSTDPLPFTFPEQSLQFMA